MRWEKSPAPSLLAPGAQRGDRDQHAARQHGAGGGRDRKAERDQQRDPQQLVADRRERLRGRLLEEHVPAEFRHCACRGQHRTAVGIVARQRRLVVGRHDGRDLRQFRKILADLRAVGRTRQHPAARIHHIGERRLAELGVAEEFGEEAEIDIGHRDAGVEAGMRHRDRHRRLGAAEFGRRVIDALGLRFGETHVAGDNPRRLTPSPWCATAAAIRGPGSRSRRAGARRARR